MLRVYHPNKTCLATNQVVKTGLNRGGKTHNIAIQPFCSNVAKQVVQFLLTVFPYLNTDTCLSPPRSVY